MRRRRFLLASGTTLAGGALAGCTGSDSDDGQNGNRSSTKGSNGAGTPEKTTASGGKPTADGFKLVSADVPKKVTMGEQFSISLTIKNVGSSPAAFHSTIHVEGSSPGSQQTGQIQTGKIAPGKTKTWSTKLTYPYVAKVNYRIEKLEKTFTIDIVGENLGFGETFTSPTEVAITVQDLTLTRHYQYERGNGESEDVEADDGRQWAFITLKAKNKFRMKQTLPKGAEFHLLHGGRKISPSDIAKSDGEYKVEKFGDRSVASGQSLTGWLAYELPASASASDLTVEWQATDDNGSWWARWSQ